MARRPQIVGAMVPPSGGGLDLSLVAWEGGPAYWSQFQKADDAGWSSDTFFPISVFLGASEFAADYAAVGINTYQAADSNHPPLTDITDEGLFVLANPPNPYNGDPGWDDVDVGSNPLIVGWFLCDEPDQGYAGFIGTDDEDGYLAVLEALAADRRAEGDGRFVFANFGNGIAGPGGFWSPNNFTTMVRTVDAACVDKYAYTSPNARAALEFSNNWPVGEDPQCSGAYGWMCRELREVFDDPNNRRPFWMFVETKMPYLDEAGAEVILYAQIEGAVWSAIANEARGIAYFDYNGFYPGGLPTNDPNTGVAHDEGNPAIPSTEQGLRDAITTINSQVTALAPVINTQSYDFDFTATGVETMLKAKDGYAYIFSSLGIGATTGSKTFTLTGTGITGTTVDVLNESRSINVSGGSFDDTFSNEYSHHTYKIAI